MVDVGVVRVVAVARVGGVVVVVVVAVVRGGRVCVVGGTGNGQWRIGDIFWSESPAREGGGEEEEGGGGARYYLLASRRGREGQGGQWLAAGDLRRCVGVVVVVVVG